jgi:dihydrofolate synthase/folylpolyglutamate synthase
MRIAAAMARPRRTDAALERLTALHPKLIDLGLERTERLLAALENPDRQLPPVIHVAGTNGKGSTIAFMRAIAASAGLSVHTYTSPHLARFHERISLNGEPIAEDALLAILEECEAANDGEPITFFEITTAAAFLAFSRAPADLLLLETGLGGRFDSTNVLPTPAVTVITPISMDHMDFLGDTIEKIAFEKAGILKLGVPCVVGPQPVEVLGVLEEPAKELDVPLIVQDIDWSAQSVGGEGMIYRDEEGEIHLPMPSLIGGHQIANAGMAITALRCWKPGYFGFEDLADGVANANWPGRLQRLGPGSLTDSLPDGWELWLDGGHNPAAGTALAETVKGWSGTPVVLICAMQKNKDLLGFLSSFKDSAERLISIDLPGGTPGHAASDIVKAGDLLGMEGSTADSLASAIRLAANGPGGRILICGSLYLAGDVLALNAAG